MFGEVFNCSVCDFQFNTGWSHHVGGQFLICRDCVTRFVIGGGSSCWGPVPGERLQLFQECYKKRPKKRNILVPTGIFLLPSDPLEPLACPACHRVGSMTTKLMAGECCPKCRKAAIVSGGECEY